MKRVVGKCGHCGGKVMVPTHYMSTKPPVPQCDSCGAQVDETANLPTLPMQPKRPDFQHLGASKYNVPPWWMLRRGLPLP